MVCMHDLLHPCGVRVQISEHLCYTKKKNEKIIIYEKHTSTYYQNKKRKLYNYKIPKYCYFTFFFEKPINYSRR